MTQVIIDPQPNVCDASITTLPPILPNINKLRPHTPRVIGFLSLDRVIFELGGTGYVKQHTTGCE